MAKITFGEYAGFITKNQIRFQKNNKLISEKLVPPEVVAHLRRKLERQILADNPPVELQSTQPVTDEEIEAVASTIEVPKETPLVPEPEVLEPKQEALEPMNTPVDPDFLESVSIHTASLEDIAQSLYERFGIYSVYLNKMPANDEVNPLTGETFTKHHLGMAYQASIRAQHSGILKRPPELARVAIDNGRAASENRRDAFVPLPTTMGEARIQDSFAYRTSVRGASGYGQNSAKGEMINVVGEDGQVHSSRLDVGAPDGQSPSGMISVQPDGRFDLDEPLAEPPFRGKKIIRPNW